MVMDITEIQSIIPHRYPMLLIDRVIELEPLYNVLRKIKAKNFIMFINNYNF